EKKEKGKGIITPKDKDDKKDDKKPDDKKEEKKGDKKADDKKADDKDKKDKGKDDKKGEKKEFVWPDKPTPGMIVARRMRLCDFFAQAGWFDMVEEQLDRLLKDFPDQKKRVEEARTLVAKLRARDEYEQIKNWYHGGRTEGVRKRLEKFPEQHASDRV